MHYSHLLIFKRNCLPGSALWELKLRIYLNVRDAIVRDDNDHLEKDYLEKAKGHLWRGVCKVSIVFAILLCAITGRWGG